MPRSLPDIISAGHQLLAPTPAPENFKTAAVVSVISSLLGRRVWIDTDAGFPRAYANIYSMLIAPPGVGKDVVISWASDVLSELQEQLAPRRIWATAGTSISPKGIYDALGSTDHCEQTFTYNRKVHSFRSLTFHIGEMSTVMPEFNQILVGILNELYNCKPLATDRIRGQEIIIPNPHLTLLVGNQPDTLFATLPERAFHSGFTSRFCIFQAKERRRGKLFNISDEPMIDLPDPELRSRFLDCLHDVSLMSGPFRITKAAGQWLNHFAEEEPYPVPGSRWADYNPRRILHVMKLAMIYSASERSDRKLELSHCESALTLMRSYEKDLPHLFDGVVSAEGFSSIFEEVYELVERLAISILVPDPKNPSQERLSHYEVTHLKLSRELSRVHNPHKQEKLFAELKRSGILVPKMDKAEGQPAVLHQPLTYIVRPLV
jgi:hypothetical protein